MSALAIAAVGEVCADLYEGDATVFLGGISGNFARSAAEAGARASVFAAVGNDELGGALIELLGATRVEPRIRVLPGKTAVQRIRIAPDGERVFCGFDAGVVAEYTLTADELAELSRFDAVAVPLAPETERIVAQLAAAGGHRALVGDVSRDSAGDDLCAWLAPRLESLALAIAFVGGSVADLEPLRVLSERARALIVLTAGAAGAWALDGGRAIHRSSLATRIVDTTGCGDAFQGAFAVRHLTGASLEASLYAGAEAAATVAAKRGAGS